MAFNSNLPSLANQVLESYNSVSLSNPNLFEDRLEEYLKKVANVVNTKEGGLYTLSERIAFKTVFTASDPQTFRNIYRKCFDLIDLNGGNIASGATVSFAHNITSLTDSIDIRVSCVSTDPEYFTVVYPDVWLDSTNINFTNPHGSAVTSAIAICEYTKN